jgi:hypothetical protein
MFVVYEELHILYAFANIIRQRFWCESPKERGHSEDRVVDGIMGTEWILRRLAGGRRVDLVGSG